MTGLERWFARVNDRIHWLVHAAIGVFVLVLGVRAVLEQEAVVGGARQIPAEIAFVRANPDAHRTGVDVSVLCRYDINGRRHAGWVHGSAEQVAARTSRPTSAPAAASLTRPADPIAAQSPIGGMIVVYCAPAAPRRPTLVPPRRAFEPYLTLLICAVLGGTIGAIASFSGSDNIITIAAEAFGPSLIDQHEHRARRLVGVLIILASLATAAGGLLHYYLVARTTG